MIITTPILIAMLVIAAFISIALPIATLAAYTYYRRWSENRKLQAADELKKAAREFAVAAVREYLGEKDQKILAKLDKQVQNTGIQPEPPAGLPFHLNREKLLAAKARLEQPEPDDHGIPELGSHTPLDAWREVDEALLDLENNNG